MFGGYWGYMAAPAKETIEQTLVWIARHEVESEQAEQAKADADAKARDAERNRR